MTLKQCKISVHWLHWHIRYPLSNVNGEQAITKQPKQQHYKLDKQLPHQPSTEGASAKSVTSTCSPQGRMLSSILFSIYTDQIRSLSENIRIIKFTDEPLVQELLDQHQRSELQSTINNIYRWYQNHEFLLNAGKIKALTFSNSKDNLVCPVLTINNTEKEEVSDYKYLGTILNSELKYASNI